MFKPQYTRVYLAVVAVLLLIWLMIWLEMNGIEGNHSPIHFLKWLLAVAGGGLVGAFLGKGARVGVKNSMRNPAVARSVVVVMSAGLVFSGISTVRTVQIPLAAYLPSYSASSKKLLASDTSTSTTPNPLYSKITETKTATNNQEKNNADSITNTSKTQTKTLADANSSISAKENLSPSPAVLAPATDDKGLTSAAVDAKSTTNTKSKKPLSGYQKPKIKLYADGKLISDNQAIKLPNRIDLVYEIDPQLISDMPEEANFQMENITAAIQLGNLKDNIFQRQPVTKKSTKPQATFLLRDIAPIRRSKVVFRIDALTRWDAEGKKHNQKLSDAEKTISFVVD